MMKSIYVAFWNKCVQNIFLGLIFSERSATKIHIDGIYHQVKHRLVSKCNFISFVHWANELGQRFNVPRNSSLHEVIILIMNKKFDLERETYPDQVVLIFVVFLKLYHSNLKGLELFAIKSMCILSWIVLCTTIPKLAPLYSGLCFAVKHGGFSSV